MASTGCAHRHGCHNRVVAILSERRANVVRLAAGPVALVYALGALAVARGPGVYSTYAGYSAAVAMLAVVAGLALAAVGPVSTSGRPVRRIADLALVAGFVWFAPIWIGWTDGPYLVRSLATLAASFLFAVLLHLVLAYPSGQVRPTLARALVAAVYVEAALSAIGRALFRDPFSATLTCWDNCLANVFLVRSIPSIARVIQDVDIWFTAIAAVLLASFCIWRSLTATNPARRMLWPILSAGVVIAAATAARSIRLARMAEDSADPVFLSIFKVLCVGVTLLAAGLLWAGLRARVQRRSVRLIVAGLGEAPAAGSLESALAQALGDPELKIAYWLPGSRRYVDAFGHPLADPAAGPKREVTPLVRDGRQVAVVTHAAALPELEREIGAAVRLALENERLQAEVLSQLEDLRASRARIVETGDAARRRLERDLHDGAQQRLLALSYDLRLARAGAEADGDAGTASLLAGATDDTLKALAELRELAHGIYPAILSEAGLAPALATLADTAQIPVEIVDSPEERYASPVETAAYVVVAEALEDASTRGATRARVRAVREDGLLMVSVDDDGAERASAMVQVADRVGALGGSMDVGPVTLSAQIPCA